MKPTNIAATISVATLVAACGAGYNPSYPPPPPPEVRLPTGSPITITNDMKAKARAGLPSILKDPDSARFGEMFASRLNNGDIKICGYVNAKNAMGGYTGMTPFYGVISDGKFSPRFVGGTRDHTYAVYSICSEAGLFTAEFELYKEAQRMGLR